MFSLNSKSKNEPYLIYLPAFNVGVGGGSVKKVKLYNIHSAPRIKPILSIENPFKELQSELNIFKFRPRIWRLQDG